MLPASAWRNLDHSWFGPLQKIARFPYHDGSAPLSLSPIPVPVSVYFQIGSNHIELIAFGGSDHKGIPHPFSPIVDVSTGFPPFSSFQRSGSFPSLSAKVDLLAVRRPFSRKVGEEITRVIFLEPDSLLPLP